MFKKEFRDTLIILAHSSLLFLALPLLNNVDYGVASLEREFASVFNLIYTLFVIVFAAYAGAAFFSHEKKENAFEYLFSLPLPRWKMFLYKLAPRLLVLLLLIAAGVILSVFSDIPADVFGLLFLFLSALFLGLVVDSLIMGLLGVLTVNMLFYFAVLIINYIAIEAAGTGEPAGFFLSLLLPGLLLLAPLGTAFALCFKRMDLKPLELHLKPYALIVSPMVFFFVVFFLLFFRDYFSWVRKF
ncbi:MAG: hypothetical protein KAW12_07975 [Candidatus Aminicenantes bacterium]|nr:hypothetical protein [Candidatus Aminicenantes bacterium]